MQPCPLCGSSAALPVESVAADELAGLYRRSLDIEIGHLLPGAFIEYRKCPACDLRYFDGAAPGDQAFYAALNRREWYYMEEKPEFRFAQSLIGPADGVLEVGAGAGSFAKLVSPGRYTGLEFSERARRVAREAGVELLDETVEAHAAANAGRYDLVCHFQVLEHVPDPRGFLAACVACLKPEGRLLVAVPAYDSFLRYSTNNLLNLPPHHLTHWSDEALRSVGRLFQLELVSLTHEPVASFHRLGYQNAWFGYALSRLFGRHPKLVDTGWAQRLVSRAAGAAAIRLEPGAPDFLFGRGHTVSAVFRRAQ